ncbi:EEF1A lysine methyltransferase 1 isoform X2 [Cajanus cajan]|uniref:Protein-lysine N-methyltransferase KK1_006649 n=1 Tax=Cajanus cajan TaxID=3821 RepID=A0A151U3Y9_CAJCA|nr:EEF1A lysine methyltransferase 1 isoform X1 [Cajanus cajan]XP_020206755.1 EEF1A lysine methyltransferase 1 isoform X2 [Cajanus cajan]KYP73984.1 N(6)-adenine-specific DNA methyltransferase 2 [Cajanus cajan]
MEEQLQPNPNSVTGLTGSSPPLHHDDDGEPVLSSHTLAALNEFLAEQQRDSAAGDSEVSLVSEDWRLSQFWYSAETATTVAQEVLTLCAAANSRVACIACPTLYAYLKNMDPGVSVQLLEYDKRFEQYGSDYTFYDYNHPEEIPSELKHSCRVVVADPPYLSKECLEKVAETIRLLIQPGESFLLLLTGDVQKESAAEILGLHPCRFRPQHSSKLGNEFRLFLNYDPGTRLGGLEK